MVIHENIDPRRPLYEYVVDKSFLKSAKKLSAFIYSINPELRVYCYQYPTNQSYTCWYVGFADRQNPYILHFNIEHTERRDGSEYRV
jgi:hypothetical protein